jgi:hypothetical protein
LKFSYKFHLERLRPIVRRTRRLHDLQRHRGEYIIPGPNYLWSIDGYCKLNFYGFELYAAIDAYSRYIVWVYIGISSRTAISVLKQYLDTLRTQKVFPLIIRSDRGVETPLIAAAHHKFRQNHESDVVFEECYRFGTSTANQRIAIPMESKFFSPFNFFLLILILIFLGLF